MYCPNCNVENEDSALFCAECGTRLQPLGQTVPVQMDPAGFQPLGQTMSPQAPMNMESQESHAPLPVYQPAFQSSFSEEPKTPDIMPKPVYLGAEETPEKKQRSKFLVPMVIFAVLFGLAAAGLGVGSYFFFKQKNDHEMKTEDLEERLEDRKQKLEEQYAEIEELQGKNKSLEQSNSDLKGSLTTALQQRDEYKKQAEDATKNAGDLNNQTILAEIDKYAPANSKYFATKNVVVLHPGETETIQVGINYRGKFTVYWNSDNRLVSPTWKQDWEYQGDIGICSISFTAGNNTGRTTVTFTNDVNSETFQVVVYIIK